jgi:hypothetical protein
MLPLIAHTGRELDVLLAIVGIPLAAYLLWGVVRWMNERDDPLDPDRQHPPEPP